MAQVPPPPAGTCVYGFGRHSSRGLHVTSIAGAAEPLPAVAQKGARTTQYH
jgi:hypothetical protein